MLPHSPSSEESQPEYPPDPAQQSTSSSSTAHPYSRLTPDFLLDALASIGQYGDGRLLTLNSYENRVYQIGMEDGPPLVAKFYRPERWSDAAILEEHAFAQELADEEIPVVPPLALSPGSGDLTTLHHFDGFRFALFKRRGGRSPELDDAATREWIGRFIGRIHAMGARQNYVHRPGIDLQNFGIEPYQFLLQSSFIPADLMPAWRSVVEQALTGVQHCYDRAGKTRSLRLHGDCHASNILWTPPAHTHIQTLDAGPHFVDFDDSRMGPAIQDLWMLLSGTRQEMSVQLADLLAGYEDFFEFDPRELHLLEGLRTLRLIHYSAWLARRWNDPAFPAAFPWFNTNRYWQDRILELREQIALMDEEPLWPAP